MKDKKIIPIFFATDTNYLPYLTVSIASLYKNASKEYDYKIYILHSGLNGKDAEKLMEYNKDGFSIQYVDVGDHIKKLEKFFCIRDYYTDAIYYRLFIVNMFPEYEKVIYLDSDTVILGDISEFYNVELGENLLGAVKDQVVNSFACFQRYTKEALGIPPQNYFNSGVLLMNLKKLREKNFYGEFHDTLEEYPFRVAPDQDCLNIICKDRVYYFSEEWNLMPISGKQSCLPKIIHYNLAQKPWHYDDVVYGEYFWHYANETAFIERIKKAKENFTPSMMEQDKKGQAALEDLAIAEAEREDNYRKLYERKG